MLHKQTPPLSINQLKAIVKGANNGLAGNGWVRTKGTGLIKGNNGAYRQNLCGCSRKGGKVEILLDKKNLTSQYTPVPFVAKAGIPMKIDSAHDIAFNKIIMMDGRLWFAGLSTSPNRQRIRTLRTSWWFGIKLRLRSTSRTGRSMRGILKFMRGSECMAEKLDGKEAVSFEELLMSNVYTQGALINLLEKKGILTKAEVLEEIKRLRERQNRTKARWGLLPERGIWLVLPKVVPFDQ
jgi:hypothetical protein